MSHTPPVDRYPPSLVKSAVVVLIAFVAAAAFAWLLGRTAGDGGAASLAWMGTPWGAALVGARVDGAVAGRPGAPSRVSPGGPGDMIPEARPAVP